MCPESSPRGFHFGRCDGLSQSLTVKWRAWKGDRPTLVLQELVKVTTLLVSFSDLTSFGGGFGESDYNFTQTVQSPLGNAMLHVSCPQWTEE